MNDDLHENHVGECIEMVENVRDGIGEDRKAPPVTTDQVAELDRRLKAYELDKNGGRAAVDALVDVRRRL
jgi:putative addiction module component (TIGR02574 family)